jgi:hypothetical protein
VELEHATVGELEHLIATAESAGLVDQKAKLIFAALHEILESERVRTSNEEDPSLMLLSETAISDLMDPLEALNRLEGQLEEHRT